MRHKFFNSDPGKDFRQNCVLEKLYWVENTFDTQDARFDYTVQ